MSKSRCSSKRYDMIPRRSCLEVERFQNVCKANYPPYCFVFWRCWYNELLFTTKIFYFFDQDYLVKIHKDLTYSVRRPYVRKYDCQSRSWTTLYKNLRNKERTLEARFDEVVLVLGKSYFNMRSVSVTVTLICCGLFFLLMHCI